MEIINSFILSSYLVNYFLFIIAIGIYILEFYRRDESKREGIINFLLLSIGGIGYVILSTYSYFLDFSPTWYIFVMLAFLVFLIIIFSWTVYRLWGKINKQLFFSCLVFCLSFLSFGILLKFYLNTVFEVVYSFSLMTGVVLYYFLIIKFLIDTKRS